MLREELIVQEREELQMTPLSRGQGTMPQGTEIVHPHHRREAEY